MALNVIGLTEIDIEFSDDEASDQFPCEVAPVDGNQDQEPVIESLGADLLDVIPQPQASGQPRHDTQILVDGNYVYKATVLKNAFSAAPLSKDRLRRVQGLTRYVDNQNSQTGIDIEDAIMVGDPILIYQHNEISVALVCKLERGSAKVKVLSSQQINEKNVLVTCKTLELKPEGDLYIWNGQFRHSEIAIPGSRCFAVSPTVSHENGKSSFAFDRQMILDLGVGIQQAGGIPDSECSVVDTGKRKKTVARKCEICKDMTGM